MGKINAPKPKILTGGEMMSEADRMTRAEIEAKRGIVREENGGIVMTPKQIEKRIAALLEKKIVVRKTIKEAEAKKQKAKVEILNQRLKDIDAKIKELKK
jgi:polyhydroxyalkanoate synthesis regulator phasin